MEITMETIYNNVLDLRQSFGINRKPASRLTCKSRTIK